jgi:hypothetical protein
LYFVADAWEEGEIYSDASEFDKAAETFELGRKAESIGLFVKADVLTGPADVTLFGTVGVAFHAQTVTHLIEKFHGRFFPREWFPTIFARRWTQTIRR